MILSDTALKHENRKVVPFLSTISGSFCIVELSSKSMSVENERKHFYCEEGNGESGQLDNNDFT